MKIIKSGIVKRTKYFILDRPALNENYILAKQTYRKKITNLFETGSFLSVSIAFDNKFKS